MNLKNFLKTHQQRLVFAISLCLMAGLGFSLGQITASEVKPPEIRVEEAFAPLNNSSESGPNQSSANNKTQAKATLNTNNGDLDCKGQIKGNISGTNKIYHLPGGSSYNKTKPEACFDTEAQAISAGFRKANN